MTLFHVNDGNKVGIYTPLSWDSNSEWKFDMDTFVFNLNTNKQYKKIKSDLSIIVIVHSVHKLLILDVLETIQ